MDIRQRTNTNSPLENIPNQKIKDCFSENKSFSFKDSKNSNNSSGKMMLHFRKGKSQSDGVVNSKMTININRKKIFCYLKDEKDFFRSIRSYNYYENLKKKFIQFEQNASLNSSGKKKNEQINIDNNIDLSSLRISDENNDFIYVEDFNSLQNLKNDSKKNIFDLNYRKAGTTNDKQFFNKIITNFNSGDSTKKIKCVTNISQTNNNLIINSNENLIVNTTSQNLEKSKNNDNDNIDTSILHHFNQNCNRNSSIDDKSNKNSNFDSRMFFPIGYTICELCDLLVPKKLLISLTPCEHTFCTRCGKNYYEDKIETGNINELTCPYYNCKSILPIDILIKLISDNLLNRYYRLINKSLISMQTMKKSLKNSTTINISTYFSTIQDYNKKHVIDVSQNENMYYLYHKYKEHFCQKCNLPSLFGKNCKNTLKCLNCLGKFCKFCLQSIESPDHFNTLNERNCCKNYLKFYREQMKPKMNNKCLVFYYQRFIFFLITFFFLVLIGVFYINKLLLIIFCEINFRKVNKPSTTIDQKIKKETKSSRFNPAITIKNFELVGHTLTNKLKKRTKVIKSKITFQTLVLKFFKFILFIVFISLFILLDLLLIPYFPLLSFFLF